MPAGPADAHLRGNWPVVVSDHFNNVNTNVWAVGQSNDFGNPDNGVFDRSNVLSVNSPDAGANGKVLQIWSK